MYTHITHNCKIILNAEKHKIRHDVIDVNNPVKTKRRLLTSSGVCNMI